MWKEKIKIILLLILGIVAITALRFANQDTLWGLNIFLGAIAIYCYYEIEEKNRKIEQLEKDWRFCKDLLDKERTEK